MSESALYRAVSRVTGESIQVIEQLGFQLEVNDGNDSDGDTPSPDLASAWPQSACTWHR